MKSVFKFNPTTASGVKVLLIDQALECGCELVKNLQAHGWFKAKLGETYLVPEHPSDHLPRLLVGLGDAQKMTVDDYRLLAFKMAKAATAAKLGELQLEMDKPAHLCLRAVTQAMFEGVWRADYAFDQYMTEKEATPGLTINLTVPADKVDKVSAGYEELSDVMTGLEFTQELVNQPANVMYPEVMAKRAKELLEPLGVKVEIMGRKACEELGMGAFLAVSAGSGKEPQFVVMSYEGNPDSDERLGLVGKGITYDSGGYSIKPTDGMLTMHCDMTGGATVMGAIYAIAKRQLKVNVVGATALCENMLSGNSYKPGDIVKSLSGKTIEIGNTDAEGRVTLADSVYYVSSRLKVTKIIDIATLTGACLIAFGEEYTGAVTNNADFFAELQAAANRADEKVWQLPSSERFKEMNRSKKADIKNVAGRLGGTITAGLFVGEFVANNLPWIHLDIAGTAYLSKPYGYLPEFATGTQVKTFYYLAKQMANAFDACAR